MIASINQPAYLPWLGYFERIARSDVHVVLDHVQFEKNSFVNRNRVRTREGSCWLTVPLRTSGKFGDLAICDLQIVEGDKWARKHWETLRMNYAKAPYFRDHAPFFEGVYSRPAPSLAGLMSEITRYLLGCFGILARIVRSSDLASRGKKDELVLNLCREVGADRYLSGALGREYLREEIFNEAGIAVTYQDYRHPTYPQVQGGFEPNMAAIDLLFNCGPRSRAVLLGDG